MVSRLPTPEEDAAWTPHGTGYNDVGQLTITVGPIGAFGKRKVTARLGDKFHVHTFDPYDQSQRRQFREAAISKLYLPEDAHEFLEEKILAAAETTTALFKPVVTMLNTVAPTAVEWLWKNKLVIGKNNLVCGNPGLGKSLFALDVAARVSRGDAFPDGSALDKPGGVVILTMEDDAADTIVPRLLSHNADLSRIAHVQGLTDVDGDGKTIHGIDLGQDIEAIRAAIQQVENCKLVIVDTISDYLGSKVDCNKNRDVRSVLNPMAALANECRVATLCISHLRKSEGLAIHATMGSVGFVGQCRVAWAITRCPTNPRRRLLTCIKSNLADDNTGLAYLIEPFGPDGGPIVCWEADPIRMSADEAMVQLRAKPGPKPDGRNNAADWLSQHLADGPKPAADVLDDAEADGFKPWTMRRAFKQLDCKRHKGGFDEGWIWSLPQDDTEDNTQDADSVICNLRHLRTNPEDNVQKKKINKVVREKVTNSESVTFDAFEAENRALSNGTTGGEW